MITVPRETTLVWYTTENSHPPADSVEFDLLVYVRYMGAYGYYVGARSDGVWVVNGLGNGATIIAWCVLSPLIA